MLVFRQSMDLPSFCSNVNNSFLPRGISTNGQGIMKKASTIDRQGGNILWCPPRLASSQGHRRVTLDNAIVQEKKPITQEQTTSKREHSTDILICPLLLPLYGGNLIIFLRSSSHTSLEYLGSLGKQM